MSIVLSPWLVVFVRAATGNKYGLQTGLACHDNPLGPFLWPALLRTKTTFLARIEMWKSRPATYRSGRPRDVGRRCKIARSETRASLFLEAAAVARVFLWVQCTPVSTEWRDEDQRTSAHTVSFIIGKQPGGQCAESLILGGKHACLWHDKELFPFFYARS